MIGLNLSNALNSAAAIYILIPIILIPQILLGGLIIEFDDMPFKMKKNNNVNFIGNIMISRWAFEAAAVGQFKYNDYHKHFFDIEKKIVDYLYYGDLLIPELKRRIESAVKSNTDLQEKDSKKIKNELLELYARYPVFKFTSVPDDLNRIFENLEFIRLEFKNWRAQSERRKDAVINDLKGKLGVDNFEILRKEYSNDALSDIVKKSRNTEFYRESDERFVRLTAPIYKEPLSNFGAAHFYASEKKIFDYYFETPVFNLIIIWIISVFLYLLLYFNILRKLLY